MFIKPLPVGVNPPLEEDRVPLWQVVNGDSWSMTTVANKLDGTPASPTNSKVSFVLSQDRFSWVPYWTGDWNKGVTEVDRASHPGLIKITIPAEISRNLRRGSYFFSLTVSDLLGNNICTVMTGAMDVEYEPTSPDHNVPYVGPEQLHEY